MFLFIKIIICITLLLQWFRAVRQDFFPSIGNLLFILFLVILNFDIFALNQEAIKTHSLIHLIVDRVILLPFSLFYLQHMTQHYWIKALLSMIWVFVFYFLEILNEQFHVVELHHWTLGKMAYIGINMIILTLLMSFTFKKITRSRTHNASSNQIR